MQQWRPTWMLAAGFVAVWAGLLVFPALRTVLFLSFFSVVLAAILSFPIGLFSRVLPRWAATGLTLVLTAGLLVGAVWLVVPPAVEQVHRLLGRLPAAVQRVQSWWHSLDEGALVPGGLLPPDPEQLVSRLQQDLGRLALGAVPLAASTLSAAGHALAALVLAFFIAHRPQLYQGGLLALIPSSREENTRQVLQAMSQAVRSWAGGTLVSMTVVGALTAIGLLIVGVDVWFALAVIAFFGEFIPFLGPILAAVPAIIAGLAVSPSTALWVAGVYLLVQQLESNLVQPMAMRWAVRIPPALLIVWQIAFATAFGLPGLLISTPLLAALQKGIQKGYVEQTLGKQAS